MNFNSGAFLLFLPLTVAAYWLLPHRLRWVLLLGASYYFYMYWNPWLVVLLLITTLTSYAAALAMERWPRRRKPLLALTLVVCLGILAYIKYANFFLESFFFLFNHLTGGSGSLSLRLLLPVGISFYTFQTLSYVIDVYRGDFPAERHLGYYALFVVYFPQLVAGPIENPRNLLPQLQTEHRLNQADLSAGFRLLLCGFFRKCAVADVLGVHVNAVFSSIGEANALAVASAGALFCLQMYCDFAGYSEIAAGSARLMGIRLMRNFDRPYLAQSYGEFFRRWHISLNQWFTSYLYIPLGGGRKGLGRKMLNTVIVFSLCGLWHGARWTYVLWGLYAAFFVCLESLLKKPAGRLAVRMSLDLTSPTVKLLRRSYMFLIFIPAALLFRAESFEQVKELFAVLASGWQMDNAAIRAALSSLRLDGLGVLWVLTALLCMVKLYAWGLYDLPEAKTETGSAARVTAEVYLLLVIALSWFSLLATQDAAGFAYFQF